MAVEKICADCGAVTAGIASSWVRVLGAGAGGGVVVMFIARQYRVRVAWGGNGDGQ